MLCRGYENSHWQHNIPKLRHCLVDVTNAIRGNSIAVGEKEPPWGRVKRVTMSCDLGVEADHLLPEPVPHRLLLIVNHTICIHISQWPLGDEKLGTNHPSLYAHVHYPLSIIRTHPTAQNPAPHTNMLMCTHPGRQQRRKYSFT